MSHWHSSLADVIARFLALPAGVKGLQALGLLQRTDSLEQPSGIDDRGEVVQEPFGPPVFISGCSRGGTSILVRLLSHHPELNCVGRGQYHDTQWVWEKQFDDRSHHRWAIEPWLTTMRKTAADATPEMLAYFRQTYRSACTEGRMLEKTPANAVRLPFIDRLYPDCYIVHIVRDGRHTAASLMARRVKPHYAAQQWVGVHTIALSDIEQIGPDRTVVVRYEELARSPVETLLGLCRLCGLDTGPHVRDLLSSAAEMHLTEPCDRWSALGQADRRQVLSIIGDLQAELGYPVEE
jgi:hypothetical protein